ncbi:hypothetical protein KIN20_032416 [Parelaphostrongylus tenuis]|uniref:Uncharacterized protein n=1 Tax=Parelaphostrongylus tenuis TaxID=148309 RepID=A0AAD5WI07_PARTN|nr:hypothetical protein KIN20_032416 [Parelaphostrongylus tenuis]
MFLLSTITSRKRRAVNVGHHGEFAPPSSQMNLLVRNTIAMAEAYAHASIRSCTGQKSPPSIRTGYQESVHVLSTTATDALGILEKAIATFLDELTSNDIPSNMIFTSYLAQRTSKPMSRVSKRIMLGIPHTKQVRDEMRKL